MDGEFLNPSDYTTRLGNYIHVGKMVWIQVNIKINYKYTLTDPKSFIKITLPIQAKTNLKQSLYVSNIINPDSNISWIEAEIPSGNSIDYLLLPIKESQLVLSSYLAVEDLTNTTEIILGGYYFTN